MQQTIKVPVTHSSLETMAEAGWDLSDGGFAERDFYGQIAKKKIRSCLTERQQFIIKYLSEGRTRKEIASKLLISEQAVHQIIPRIRKRLRDKMGIDMKKIGRKSGGI